MRFVKRDLSTADVQHIRKHCTRWKFGCYTLKLAARGQLSERQKENVLARLAGCAQRAQLTSDPTESTADSRV